MSTATYREPVTWQPERPRFRLARVVTAWILAALALMAAAWLVPGASIEGFWGALLVSAVVAALNAVLPPLLAALKLPFTLVAGFLLVLLADALMLARRGRDHGQRDPPGLLLDRAPRRARRLGGDRRPRGHHRLERRRHLHDQGHPAAGEAVGRAGRVGRAGNRLPRDRRPRAAHPPQRDAGRQRAAHGELDGRARLRAHGVGARPLVADGREPGGDPARLERGHPGLPLGREGDRPR